jgi:hypothetical protein
VVIDLSCINLLTLIIAAERIISSASIKTYGFFSEMQKAMGADLLKR